MVEYKENKRDNDEGGRGLNNEKSIRMHEGESAKTNQVVGREWKVRKSNTQTLACDLRTPALPRMTRKRKGRQ